MRFRILHILTYVTSGGAGEGWDAQLARTRAKLMHALNGNGAAKSVEHGGQQRQGCGMAGGCCAGGGHAVESATNGSTRRRCRSPHSQLRFLATKWGKHSLLSTRTVEFHKDIGIGVEIRYDVCWVAQCCYVSVTFMGKGT